MFGSDSDEEGPEFVIPDVEEKIFVCRIDAQVLESFKIKSDVEIYG